MNEVHRIFINTKICQQITIHSLPFPATIVLQTNLVQVIMHERYRKPHPMPCAYYIKKSIRMPASRNNQTTNARKTGNVTGNNGNLHLWTFLLKTLLSQGHQNKIQWLGNKHEEEGVFKIVNLLEISKMWRTAKQVRPATNESNDP